MKTSEKKSEEQHKQPQVVKKSSVVEVKSGPPATVYSSIVEVRGGPQSSQNTPQLSSKVEVRAGPAVTKKHVIASTKVEIKQATPSTVVEIRTGDIKIQSNVFEEVRPKSSIVNVKVGGAPKPIVTVKESKPKIEVNVKGGVPKPIAILSSKVEVISSSDEPAISGNNLDSPAEYDFLSRQPSEIVDETYKVSRLCLNQ